MSDVKIVIKCNQCGKDHNAANNAPEEDRVEHNGNGNQICRYCGSQDLAVRLLGVEEL